MEESNEVVSDEEAMRDEQATNNKTTQELDRERARQSFHTADFLNALNRSLAEGIYAVDAAGRATFLNRAAEEMLGWREDELAGKNVHETIHHKRPDGSAFPVAECALLGVRQTGETLREHEDAFIKRDGGVLFVRCSSAPIITDGQMTGAVVTFHDISESKTQQAKLQESEERYRTVAEAASDALITIDEKSRILYVNPATERMFGYTAAELSEMNLTMLMPEKFRARHHAGISSYVRTGERNIPWSAVPATGLRKDGREFPLEISFGEFVKAGKHFFTGIVRDVSERKRAEAELQATQQLYETLANAMPQLVWATDEDGAHFYYNQQWYDFTGLTEEESMGYGFTNALHPEDKERALQRWERAWKNGESYEIEYRIFSRPQDKYRWFLGRAAPVRDAQGKVMQWVGTCTDIEEQKHMEVTLARLYREREQFLEEVSVPLVPVARGVLVLPLIGSLDTTRMQRATDVALDEMTKTRARLMIIDITGARIIDSHAVANLHKLIAAIKLIGAEAVVTGVTAHAAQNLVNLGVDFEGVRTHRTLAEALEKLDKRMKLQ